MARGSSSSKKVERGSSREPNPEVTERKRLKRLAFANSVLSETPANAHAPLSPSKAVIKHHGKDIAKKSQRKNRFLFSFPGLFAPLGGGKIGELKDLGSKNPVLYLDFPQGRMKLFGTIVYPKNRYLTLQFPRGGKNVMCEDYFDNMIVFSEAWWIGRKDENPEEARLNFPKDVDEGQVVEYDFKGGAGAESVNNPGLHKTGMIYGDEQSPKAELEVDLSDGENNLKDPIKATPVRHSERTAGKSFNFAEASSGEDSVGSDADVSEGEEKKVVGVDSSTTKYTSGKTESLGYVALDNENKDSVERTLFPEKNEEPAMSVSKSKRLSHTATTVTTDKERSSSNNGSLVQTTISTLFKKAEEKKAPRNPRKAPSPKGCYFMISFFYYETTGIRKLRATRTIDFVQFPTRSCCIAIQKGRLMRADLVKRQKLSRKRMVIEDEDIEEFSSSSKDASGSDEDWTAEDSNLTQEIPK